MNPLRTNHFKRTPRRMHVGAGKSPSQQRTDRAPSQANSPPHRHTHPEIAASPGALHAVDMGVELKHLRYFVAVAEKLNYSAAARGLYISQQALSRIIQQLERDVGVRLFDRTTRSVRLTPAGAALLESVRPTLIMVDNAVERARSLGPRTG
jgi:hypothetical protein